MLLEQSGQELTRLGILKLLDIKDIDMRLDIVLQGKTAADRGVHSGGAFSGIVPMTAMFYGGFFKRDITNPTAKENDIFVLSKGHGVAGMAALYADLGYIDRSMLEGSRSLESELNGHPGPILPGVHVATGPLGQGIAVAVGYAEANKLGSCGDVYTLTGDGELHEGTPWEALLYAGSRRLNRLCVMVDRNNGSNDCESHLILSLGDLKAKLEAFGFEVYDTDAARYDEVFDALRVFREHKNTKPVAIILNGVKGQGGASRLIQGHKITMTDALAEQETRMLNLRRGVAVRRLREFFETLSCGELRSKLMEAASYMNMEIQVAARDQAFDVKRIFVEERPLPAPERDKTIGYDANKLAGLAVKGRDYTCHQIIAEVIKQFGQDLRVVTVDSDVSLVTGLAIGMEQVDQARAINAGIAEANMMCMSEAFASLGYNTWCGSFSVFTNWNVLRRIAVSFQEREESIALADGWLSKGHNLDIVFISAAANLDGQTNGATHLGIDDIRVFSEVPHVKVIDVSCPRQLIGIMEWVAQGNKGLIYLRIMRAACKTIYDADFAFAFGAGYTLKESREDKATIVSGGREVHEVLAAAELLEQRGIKARVIDMPSADGELFRQLAKSEAPVIFAEQNNAYLYHAFLEYAGTNGISMDAGNIHSISTLDKSGKRRFLHSGTYAQLVKALGLDGESVADYVERLICG